MKKTYSVEKTHDNMRLDRWIRNKIGKIPQGLIEKNLRNGKIKLNTRIKQQQQQHHQYHHLHYSSFVITKAGYLFGNR